MNRLLLISLGLLSLSAARAQRDTLSLNFDWQFQRGDSIFTDKAEHIDLPHDFQIAQPWVAPAKDETADNSDMAANVKSRLSARGFKEMGVGWYRKVLRPEASWRGRRVVLDFGGIMLTGDVWLNGQRIGGTDYGYVGFELDITEQLIWDKDNVLLVKADTQAPNNSRWYTGGGINRDVRLLLMPRNCHFSRHPLRIVTDMQGHVTVEAEAFIDDRKMTDFVLGAVITDNDGHEVASCMTKQHYQRKWKERIYALDTMTVRRPKLWSCESPYLYNMVVTLYRADGIVLDKVCERIGLRTIEFDPAYGFKLNGRKVLLKGIANHHTLGALGAAAYPRAIEKRIQLLRDFGFNHIRMSHNPYSEDMYRLCDKYGMLVVDELYDKWLKQYAGGRTDWMQLWQHDLPEWVKRDRNHPSVVLWSLGNELQTYSNLPFGDWGVTPYRLQRELLRKYDASRLVTVAMHPRGRSWETDSLPCDLARITDIQAYNYRYMYFPGDRRRFPYMNFYQSEANLSNMGPNFYGMELDKVIGLAYWGMIDYIGESRGWPAKGWTDGVFDISLQPKPLAWLVRSMFSDDPTVHIAIQEQRGNAEEWNGVQLDGVQYVDHWNLTEGQTYTVRVFTNADEAELLLNGQSLGVRRNETGNPQHRNKLTWADVTYAPGTLEAVARKDGREVARHKIETAGKAVALCLTPDNDHWSADGLDLQHVRLTAVDSKGRIDPTFNAEISFSVDGDARIVAVDNGDMTNHEVNTLPHIHAHQGTALVILRAGRKPGRVTLKATGGAFKATRLLDEW